MYYLLLMIQRRRSGWEDRDENLVAVEGRSLYRQGSEELSARPLYQKVLYLPKAAVAGVSS